MSRFSLATYAVRVHRKWHREFELLGNFDGAGGDLLETLGAYLSVRQGTTGQDANHSRMIRVDQHQVSDRQVSGTVESGEWGIEARLLEVGSGNLVHERQTDHAEMLPLYFLVDLPAAARRGVLVLQRFQQIGIRSVLFADFSEYFVGQHPDYVFEVSPLVPEQLLFDHLDRGRVTTIKFIRYDVPPDLADFYARRGQPDDQEGEVEYAVKAERDRGFDIRARINEWLGGGRPLNQLVELRDFDYQNVKLVVTLPGGERTIDLAHLDRLRAYYDIGDDVAIAPNGHPDFESIDEFAKGLVEAFNTQRMLRE